MLGVHTVAGQVLLLELALVVLLVAAAAVSLVVQGRRAAVQEARSRSYAVADTFAHSPGIVAALDSRDPTAVLQPRAEAVRKSTRVEYVVVASTRGFRYTHPDPALTGKHILGPYKEALLGHGFTETFKGSRGPAVNSVVPVPRADGSAAGLVSVGITVTNVNKMADRDLPVLFGAAVTALALTSGGAALVSRRLRRQTHGLGPAEMTRLYEHHAAVLHSVPHLRYASTTDEGGRGLYLVAQFADRWGTRYTAEGKVIWAEQTPGAGQASAFEWADDALGL